MEKQQHLNTLIANNKTLAESNQNLVNILKESTLKHQKMEGYIREIYLVLENKKQRSTRQEIHFLQLKQLLGI